MPLTHEHELHQRRRGLNTGLGLVLAAFVALVFVLTFVKVTGQTLQIPDNVPGASTAQQGATGEG